jgi:hypothetical protein
MSQIQPEFIAPASEEILHHVAEKIRERNIEVLVVNNGDEARQIILDRLPEGAEILASKSKTLQDAGILEPLLDPTKYNALRNQFIKMDRKTQAREIRKLSAGPDYMLGSVNAVTEDGVMVVTSATASQIGAYANTAGKVILIVGSQKIVPDLETALRRIRDYLLPLEDEKVFKVANIHSFVGKTLIIEREWQPDRMTVILVREPIGI